MSKQVELIVPTQRIFPPSYRFHDRIMWSELAPRGVFKCSGEHKSTPDVLTNRLEVFFGLTLIHESHDYSPVSRSI
jgi:hypothetical protein